MPISIWIKVNNNKRFLIFEEKKEIVSNGIYKMFKKIPTDSLYFSQTKNYCAIKCAK